MSKIKDKRIKIYEIVTDREKDGNEIKIKKYIHGINGLWAYVRQLRNIEQYAAKAVGENQSVVFIIAYNNVINAKMYIEFNNKTYKIENLDEYEFYKADLQITAGECVAEVTQKEIYEK